MPVSDTTYTIVAEPTPPVGGDSGMRYAARVIRPGLDEFELFVEFSGLPDQRPSDSENWLLMACLFPAMERCDKLHIAGRVDRDVLANISELNVIWNRWRPGKYRILEITADQVVDPDDVDCSHKKGWLLAFSGGVDAIAALLRHQGSQLGWRRREIHAGFFVHGFDIPLDDSIAYETAFTLAEQALCVAALPLAKVRTNLRDFGCNWEDTFGLSLAAVASLIGGGNRGLVMGSGSDYYLKPMLKWGSSPFIDPLRTSSRFQTFTDGCEQSRIDKIRVLGEDGRLNENIRVCWEGRHNGGNCGTCEKCVRTKLMFLTAGFPIPQCLGGDLTKAQLQSISLRNTAQINNLADILRLAESNGIKAWWVEDVRRLMNHERRKHFRSIPRRIARKLRGFLPL